MSYFSVTILGCGSASPTTRHYPSCQAVRYRNNVMLVDCGEGAQLQMRRYGIPFSRLRHIFISHLHGDHFLGLPGLLSTLALHNIEGTVTVHTFAEGAEVLQSTLDLFCRERSYNLVIDPVDPAGGIVYEDEQLEVVAFPLRHRVPCVGYMFREKPKRRHIKGEMARFYGVPHYAMDSLRDGADFVLGDGTVIANDRLTTDADPSLSYAYCSDTIFSMQVASAIRGCDVVYHESTYGDADHSKAAARGHSTARQAGKVAQAAGAKTLILGHYSQSILDEEQLAAEAAEEFDGTVLVGREGLVVDLV